MTIALDVASFSAIRSYTDLIAKVQQRLDRDDLAEVAPTAVALVEHYLNRELRTPEMEATASLSPIRGEARLPDDCLEVRGLYGYDGDPIEIMSLAEILRVFGNAEGPASVAALRGRTIRSLPAGALPLTLEYWQRITPLSVEAPFNWVLDNHADVYFYGVLMHLEDHLDNPAGVQKYATVFEGAVERVSATGRKLRYPGPLIARSGVRQVRGARC